MNIEIQKFPFNWKIYDVSNPPDDGYYVCLYKEDNSLVCEMLGYEHRQWVRYPTGESEDYTYIQAVAYLPANFDMPSLTEVRNFVKARV